MAICSKCRDHCGVSRIGSYEYSTCCWCGIIGEYSELDVEDTAEDEQQGEPHLSRGEG